MEAKHKKILTEIADSDEIVHYIDPEVARPLIAREYLRKVNVHNAPEGTDGKQAVNITRKGRKIAADTTTEAVPSSPVAGTRSVGSDTVAGGNG